MTEKMLITTLNLKYSVDCVEKELLWPMGLRPQYSSLKVRIQVTLNSSRIDNVLLNMKDIFPSPRQF